MQILTVVIGIIFVLLLLSLLATTMMELLSSFFSLRGRNLTKALRNMLASSDNNEILVDEFQRNSLYRHLTQQYGQRSKGFTAPSYMSAETFQSILLDVILKGEGTEKLEEKIDQLPDDDLRNVLKQLLRESGGQLDLFRLEVQNWYNNVMDRAAGWYKRYTQKILLFMGLGIAIVFNADTIAIYDRLSNDPETLEALANAAEQYVKAREQAEAMPTTTTETLPPATTNLPDNSLDPSNAASPTDTAPATAPPVTTTPSNDPSPADPSFGDRAPFDPFDTTAANTTPLNSATLAPTTYRSGSKEDIAQRDFQQSLDELKSLLNNEIAEVKQPLGLGWGEEQISDLGTYDWLSKIFGFILTALAVSLGAPFWFDLLKKLVNIRSSGARPYQE
ncbi:MAG: hypothetical protein AAGF89_10060 [Bacteroidota bacterium]